MGRKKINLVSTFLKLDVQVSRASGGRYCTGPALTRCALLCCIVVVVTWILQACLPSYPPGKAEVMPAPNFSLRRTTTTKGGHTCVQNSSGWTAHANLPFTRSFYLTHSLSPFPWPGCAGPCCLQVIISDVDVMWLRDPMPFFKKFPDADILTSSDHLTPTIGGAEALERYPDAGSAFNIGGWCWVVDQFEGGQRCPHHST